MKGSGMYLKNMVRAFINSVTVQFIQEIGKMTKKMGSGN